MPLSDSWIDFLAGWCSGGFAVMACQPVDTVLTRLQAGRRIVATAIPVAAASSSGGVGNSVTALWRGSSAMIGAVPVQNALLMGGYGVGKRWSEQYNANNNNTATAGTTTGGNSANNATALQAIFVGGFVGGILQSFLMSPVELIKVNQQIHTEQSALAAGKQVLSHVLHDSSSKIASAWRGLGATLLRDGIPHGVWFVSYEACKNYLEESVIVVASNDSTSVGATDEASSSGTNWGVPLASGAFAATVAWGVGYPFDLIKTRIQASPNASGNTIIGTAQTLIQEANGQVLQGLYRGFGLKLVRSVPASMIGFTTYELVKESIERW